MEHPKCSVLLIEELENRWAEHETESILFAMTEEHEHTRWLWRRSKNPSLNRRGGRFQTYLCAPKPPPGLLSCHRPHPAPRGYRENDPWRVRTIREGRSATSPPNVVRPRGGPAGSTGCSLGLVSDPARIDGERRRMCGLSQGDDKERRSLNTVGLTRRGRRDATRVMAHLISRPRGKG